MIRLGAIAAGASLYWFLTRRAFAAGEVAGRNVSADTLTAEQRAREALRRWGR